MSYLLRHSWLIVLALISVLLYLFNGSADTLALLLSEQSELAWQLVMELRAPRLSLAITAGACLACSGLLLQTLTGNHLADPGILGINQGAAIAVLCSVMLLPEQMLAGQALAGTAGSLLALTVIGWLSQRLSPVALILCGIGLSALLSALLNLLMLNAETHQIGQVLTWLSGSLSGAYQEKSLWLLTLALPVLMLSILLALHLKPMLLDQHTAMALGLESSTRLYCLLAAGALSALAVTAVGALAFIGLLAPHLARFSGEKTPAALLLPTLLWGCILCVLADLIARTLFAPIQLPFGLIIAITGVPVFIFLLLKKPPAAKVLS
ncbi:FecCD family ABC transporter permease [Oceanospirillum beijerinckii]|uniref:FecCD family ABC transporter permease n=1 Tax=Oceanospirillum beijerinckii TaxID=64976 RepID=UPI000424F653|nr:iron ABC transporter permease [Oceanospirillum beijerinckii]